MASPVRGGWKVTGAFSSRASFSSAGRWVPWPTMCRCMESPTRALALMATSSRWLSPWFPRYRASKTSRSSSGGPTTGMESRCTPLLTVATLRTPRARSVAANPSVTVTTRSARCWTKSTTRSTTLLTLPWTRRASRARSGHASRISTISGHAAHLGQDVAGSQGRQARRGDNDDVGLADHESGRNRQCRRKALVQQTCGPGVAVAEVGDAEDLLGELAFLRLERPPGHPARAAPAGRRDSAPRASRRRRPSRMRRTP